MFYICNIINGNQERLNLLNISYKNNIKFCENVSSIDKKLPTLIVGVQFMEDNNINYSPFTKEIRSNRIYWTYSENENYIESIEDMKEFIYNSLHYYWKTLKVKHIDPVFSDIQSVNDLPNVIDFNKKNKILYFSETTKNIYLKFGNKCMSLNSKIYEFFKLPIKELLKYFSDNGFYLIKGSEKKENKVKQKYEIENTHLISLLYMNMLITLKNSHHEH